jgi:hypothetical protein
VYFKQVPGYKRGWEPAVGGGVLISHFLPGLGVGSKPNICRKSSLKPDPVLYQRSRIVWFCKLCRISIHIQWTMSLKCITNHHVIEGAGIVMIIYGVVVAVGTVI